MADEDKPKQKVLFVCSQNLLRSPTAEQVFSTYPGIEVASAGTDKEAEVPLSSELVRWADLIFVMEKKHRAKLQRRFRADLKHARVICLDIPDDFDFMEEALVKLLEARVTKFLPERSPLPSAEKIEGSEQRIPTLWRDALKKTADAFVLGRIPAGDGIRCVDVKIVEINFVAIRDFPDAIGPLADVSWETSICAWMGDHWQVLVDLTTIDSQRSDLVLHCKVFDIGSRVEIEPGLIYVP